MEIRKAEPGDADLLTKIALEAKAHWGYPREALEGWREQLTVTRERVEGNAAFVAEVDGAVAGFCVLAQGETAWELDHLWVLPRFMKQGIGRALLERALEATSRGGARTLLVDADPNAAPFYVACGAQRTRDVAAPIAGEPGRVRPQLVFRLP